MVASSELSVVLPSQLARHFAALLALQLFDLGPFHLEVVSPAQRSAMRRCTA